MCGCLVGSALLAYGPQGSFVQIVKHCVGLVTGEREAVREKEGSTFSYN